jgi:hypothetical protein
LGEAVAPPYPKGGAIGRLLKKRLPVRKLVSRNRFFFRILILEALRYPERDLPRAGRIAREIGCRRMHGWPSGDGERWCESSHAAASAKESRVAQRRVSKESAAIKAMAYFLG